jgi:uncharacterized iron-regulated protein
VTQRLAVLVVALGALSAGSAAVRACQPHAADIFPGVQRLAEQWSQSGHPLAGKVWIRGQWIDEKAGSSCDHHPVFDVVADVLEVIKSGGVAVLGEVHDNPAHHKLRAEILSGHSWLVASAEGVGRVPTPGVVFEHIRTDQQPALEQFRQLSTALKPGTASDLFRLLEWDKSGWPDQKLFEPLFSAAITARLPLRPGDLPRDVIRRAAKEGEAAVAPEDRARLKIDQPLESRLQDALLTELEESHCGMMPKSAFGNMAFAQRYRDAHLADAVLKAAEKQGSAVLLAGNGHVRTDRGVPHYLRQRAPDRKIVTVMLVEVEDGKTDPQAYVPRDPDGKPVADYIVLTPRQERPDPCEAMRARMKPGK